MATVPLEGIQSNEEKWLNYIQTKYVLHVLGKPPNFFSMGTSQKGEWFEKESDLPSLKWYFSNPT